MTLSTTTIQVGVLLLCIALLSYVVYAKGRDENFITLPAFQGGFGKPIYNFNSVPQLGQLEQTVYTNMYGDDSIANLKLSTQHLNLIKNIN